MWPNCLVGTTVDTNTIVLGRFSNLSAGRPKTKALGAGSGRCWLFSWDRLRRIPVNLWVCGTSPCNDSAEETRQRSSLCDRRSALQNALRVPAPQITPLAESRTALWLLNMKIQRLQGMCRSWRPVGDYLLVVRRGLEACRYGFSSW